MRDDIPEIVEENEKICVWETLSDKEFLHLLEEKLNKEAAEYQKSKSLENLADLLEVLGALVAVRGYTWNQLTAPRKEKRERQGDLNEGDF